MSNAMRTQLKQMSNKCLISFKSNAINNYGISCKYKQILCSIALRPISCHSKNYQKAKSLAERQTTSQSELTIGGKVKQTTKDVSYFGVILVGVSVTGVVLYAVLRELFGSDSPNVIYSKALKLCKSDPRVIEAIGEPIKGFGEMSSRGRRRHVSSATYEKDGQSVVRVRFYLKGPKDSATVDLEAFKNKKSQFRYLLVQLDGRPKVIVLEDNRRIGSTNPPLIEP